MRRDVSPGVCIWDSHSAERRSRGASVMVPFERAIMVSYRLSIMIIALSLTVHPQLAIECL